MSEEQVQEQPVAEESQAPEAPVQEAAQPPAPESSEGFQSPYDLFILFNKSIRLPNVLQWFSTKILVSPRCHNEFP